MHTSNTCQAKTCNKWGKYWLHVALEPKKKKSHIYNIYKMGIKMGIILNRMSKNKDIFVGNFFLLHNDLKEEWQKQRRYWLVTGTKYVHKVTFTSLSLPLVTKYNIWSRCRNHKIIYWLTECLKHQLHRVTSTLFTSSNRTQVECNTKHAYYTDVKHINNNPKVSPFGIALVKRDI